MRRRLGLPPRHHIRPATAQMRPGIDRIQLNGGFRKFEGRSRLAEIAKEAGMYNMFNVIHLYEAAVARRESRIFTDGIAKNGDRALPAFRVEFRYQVLSAKPAVMNIQRHVRFARKPHQPFGRQLHIQRGRDPADDALLRFEPVVKAEAKAFAPDINAGGVSTITMLISGPA